MSLSGVNNVRGFTMIELLMVIMLVALLGAVALPQFLDFRNETRVAAARGLENVINTGIKLQKTNAKLRCGQTGEIEIPFDSFIENDITAGATPLCTTTQIVNPYERRIVDSPEFPTNPYNNLNTVGDCVNTTYVGYCYDATNSTVAVSPATSHSNTCTSCFQNTNGSGGNVDFTCSGSGCIQEANGNGGNITLSCPGGYCSQQCNGNGGSCTLTCSGGNCSQECNGNGGGCSATCSGGNCT